MPNLAELNDEDYRQVMHDALEACMRKYGTDPQFHEDILGAAMQSDQADERMVRMRRGLRALCELEALAVQGV